MVSSLVYNNLLLNKDAKINQTLTLSDSQMILLEKEIHSAVSLSCKSHVFHISYPFLDTTSNVPLHHLSKYDKQNYRFYW